MLQDGEKLDATEVEATRNVLANAYLGNISFIIVFFPFLNVSFSPAGSDTVCIYYLG